MVRGLICYDHDNNWAHVIRKAQKCTNYIKPAATNKINLRFTKAYVNVRVNCGPFVIF